MHNLKFLFLKPFFKKTIWANNNLQKLYNHNDLIGEAWLISALPNNSSLIINKDFENMNLLTFFNKNKLFFKNYPFIYPNLTKIIDAKTALSIQVHPNDEYAKKYDSLGKAEAWYVLKNEGQPFVLGIDVENKKELKKIIEDNSLEKKLVYQKLKKDDFVYIDHGQIHAIPDETMVYEIQQSSDITFRVFDYNRLGLDGKLRKLHIQESLDVINLRLKPKIIQNQKQLIENNLFYLQKYEINNLDGEVISFNKKFYWAEISVIDGSGEIDNNPIKKGDAFLLSGNFNNFLIKGKIILLINLILEK